MNNHGKQLKSNAFNITVTTCIQLLQTYFLAKILGPDQYGVLGIILLFYGFSLCIQDLGLNNAIVQSKKDIGRKTVFKAYFVLALILLGFNILFLSTVFYFSSLDLTSYIPYLCLLLFFQTLGSSFYTLLQREVKFFEIARSEVISVSLGFAVILILLNSGFGIRSYLIGLTFSAFLRLLLFFFSSKKIINICEYGNVSNVFKINIQFSIYQIFERIFNFGSARAEHFVIAFYLGPEVYGLYFFCWNLIIQPITKIIPMFTRVIYPVLCKDVREGKKNFIYLIFNTRKSILLLAIPFLIGLHSTSSEILTIFFDDDWSNAVQILQIISLIFCFRVTFDTLNMIYLATGNSKSSFSWNVIQLIINISVIVLIILLFGKESYLTGILLSSVLLFFIELKKILEFIPFSSYLKSIKSPIISSIIMLIILNVVFYKPYDVDILWIFLSKIIISLIVYFGSLKLFFKYSFKELLLKDLL